MPTGRNITLVTGATGFLGNRLCERLLSDGTYIRAIGRKYTDGPWQEFVEMDLMLENIPKEIFEEVDTIFHLAGQAHAVSESAGRQFYDPVIVDATRRLVAQSESCNVERFIYFSSVKAMGEGNPCNTGLDAMDESWPNEPQSPYGMAKAEAEALVRNSSLKHHVILRPVMVFGPGEKGNLPRMIDAVAKSRFPPIPDNGNKRSMVHVDDVVEWAIRSAQNPVAAGKTYILASASPVSTRELYDTIRRAHRMSAVNWSIPSSLLKLAAKFGSLAGGIIGKKVPFDVDTLNKLTGSSWYSSQLVQEELNYSPVYEIRNWLMDQGESQS